MRGVDEGLPISYEVLDRGVPVLTSDGQPVGTVASVIGAPEQDIFHGLLVDMPGIGVRFVPAEAVATLHEHGVDLRIDGTAAAALHGPEHDAPVYTESPDRQQTWRHWAHRLTGRGDWDRKR